MLQPLHLCAKGGVVDGFRPLGDLLKRAGDLRAVRQRGFRDELPSIPARQLLDRLAGALDPGLKFYLMSRGISEKESEALLIEAFIDETIEQIAHEGIRDALKFAALKWLGTRG